MTRVWLFDLDNTLHNAGAVFRHFDGSMNRFIEDRLGVDAACADDLRRQYWARYGSTLLGLIKHHGVGVADFVRETHRFPQLETLLEASAADLHALKRLPGRKILLTNAGRDYALRVLRLLGIAQCFDVVLGIEQMHVLGQLRPKPDARLFRRLVAMLRVPPGQCTLVEDTLIHQKSARAQGLRTVWMQRWVRQAAHGPEARTRLHRRPVYVCARINRLSRLGALRP